jgi:hypothetical protein
MVLLINSKDRNFNKAILMHPKKQNESLKFSSIVFNEQHVHRSCVSFFKPDRLWNNADALCIVYWSWGVMIIHISLYV